MSPLNRRFPKQERLQRRRDFEKVFREGRPFRGGGLQAYVLENSLGHARLGIVVGKKFGGAVQRNRIKRLLRECYRLNKHLLGPGLDVVLLPKEGIADTFQGVEEEFKRLVMRIRARN